MKITLNRLKETLELNLFFENKKNTKKESPKKEVLQEIRRDSPKKEPRRDSPKKEPRKDSPKKEPRRDMSPKKDTKKRKKFSEWDSDDDKGDDFLHRNNYESHF